MVLTVSADRNYIINEAFIRFPVNSLIFNVPKPESWQEVKWKVDTFTQKFSKGQNTFHDNDITSI